MSAGETSIHPLPTQPVEGGPVVCGGCGHENPAGVGQCADCGRFLAGNRVALLTGEHASSLTPELRSIEAEAEALVGQSITDAGGREELIAREVALHQYRGILHARILRLAAALDRHGQFDKRGHLRTAWLKQLGSLIGDARSIDQTLGLKRRAKRSGTLADYLDGQHEIES